MPTLTPAPAPVATLPVPTDRARGLSAADALQGLVRFGPNAIAETVLPAWRQLLIKLWAPVPWMLEAVIVRSCCLGADWKRW